MCTCIKQINELLKEHNTEVVYSLNLFNTDAPRQIYLMTRKLDSKKRIQPAKLIATFCPICGERYIPIIAGEAAQS